MTSQAVIPPMPPGRSSSPRRRCVRHDEREAVGRCVACGGGFCRECLTEYDDRLYCATCFARRIESGKRSVARKGVDWRRWKTGIVTAGSLLCLIAGFYFLGRVLAVIPVDVHDGTVWKEFKKP